MGTPRSIVAKQLLHDAICKELACGRRGLHEQILEKLSSTCDEKCDAATLSSHVGDLGKMYFNMSPPLKSASSPELLSFTTAVARPPVRTPVPSGQTAGNMQRLGTSSGSSCRSILQTPAVRNMPRQSSRPGSSFSSASYGILRGVPEYSPHDDGRNDALQPVVSQQDASFARRLAALKKKRPDYTRHLRQLPINMGVPDQLVSTYMADSKEPVAKAVDARWSTELSNMSNNTTLMMKYRSKLSGSGASLCPSERFFPKTYTTLLPA